MFGILKIKKYCNVWTDFIQLQLFYFNFHHPENCCLLAVMMIKTLLQSTIGDQDLCFTQAQCLRARLMEFVGGVILNLSLVETIMSSFGTRVKEDRDNLNPRQSHRSVVLHRITFT